MDKRGTWVAVVRRAEFSARARRTARNSLIALLLLLLASAVPAQTAPELRVGAYETTAAATPQEVEQLPASAFRATPSGPRHLHGEPGQVHWLRLDVDLPPLADDDSRWMLWMDHARVDQLNLYRPDQAGMPSQPSLDFFEPQGSRAEHAGGYAFALPRGLSGPTTLFVQASGQGSFSLSPRIIAESEAVLLDRDAVIVFTAVYTCLILLLLIGLGMFIALGDRLYLYYLLYLGALLVFILAHNGHLYMLPSIGKWGHWRTLGLWSLANLLAAATVALARRFAGLAQSMPRIDRILGLFPAIPVTLALLCLSNRSDLAQPAQIATAAVGLGAMLLAALATAMAWRCGRHLALPILLMWLLLFAAGCMRALVPFGLAPSNGWTQYGYQVIAALTAMTLGFALSGRIIEFRLQRDRARLAKDQVDSSLRLERERRKFAESLNELRAAAGADQEWMAFRRLLEALRQLVPQHSSAVALHAFHGNDLLLCEPNLMRDDYQTLLATRGGAFKGISRSQLPMQLRIDSPATVEGATPDLTQYAVLPLGLTAPAWGVLLIERRGWQTFDQDEMVLAAEFVQKAARAVEDAANNRAQRRNVETEALASAFNRRMANARLDAAFRQSLKLNAPLAYLLVEMDRLKEINDAHGHEVGDHCLRVLAEAIGLHCDKIGEYGRYRGGDFVVILPDKNADQARRWADAMSNDVTSQELALPSGKLRLGLNIGVASRRPEDTTAQQLIERADKALQAMRSGRDRVQLASGFEAMRGNEVF